MDAVALTMLSIFFGATRTPLNSGVRFGLAASMPEASAEAAKVLKPRFILEARPGDSRNCPQTSPIRQAFVLVILPIDSGNSP